MAARPLVGVANSNEDSVALPDVFMTPLRADLVQAVHTEIRKNKRQPYAVNYEAGHQTAAESWGTGRAVSRIPRVPGGGTHRAGQAAFGNMTRGGHMFNPTKTWRKWHRRVNLKQRRHAVCTALAGTAVAPLVLARGHRVNKTPEVPLVVPGEVESITRTRDALAALAKVDADKDVEKVKQTKTLRAGKGKMRNRRHKMRKGPLIIYSQKDAPMRRAFRNLPGVELARVDKLNLLKLAPGGQMGRFCIWTKPAFEKLDAIYGTKDKLSREKKNWKIPGSIMKTPDLNRIINSDEVQSAINPKKSSAKSEAMEEAGQKQKLNPLKRKDRMDELNPHAPEERKRAQEAQKATKAPKHKKSEEEKATARRFLARMKRDADYHGDLFDDFASWLGVAHKDKVVDDE